MNILVAGDSKKSLAIIEPLILGHHRVTVMHPDLDFCRKIANRYEEITVINADSRVESAHHDRRTRKFDRVIAVSDNDSENYVICVLYRNPSHQNNTAALINCPKNEKIFRQFGLSAVFDVNSYIMSGIS